jgi:hypothetical protein
MCRTGVFDKTARHLTHHATKTVEIVHHLLWRVDGINICTFGLCWIRKAGGGGGGGGDSGGSCRTMKMKSEKKKRVVLQAQHCHG